MQYRRIILNTSEEQKRVAEEVRGVVWFVAWRGADGCVLQ
jgi:hypothetical protein